MNFHIITLFPESLNSYINSSIIGRARSAGAISVLTYNPRDFSDGGDGRIDDIPYGGGPGMVIQALPVVRALEFALEQTLEQKKKTKLVMFSPHGKQFSNKKAEKWASSYDNLMMIAGRYEGVDARILDMFPETEEVSIGPYVLTGGELPALVVMDAVSRQVPGVLGNDTSREEEREASAKVFTRPEVILYKGKEHKVPEVLLSGNHKEIDEWRKKTKSPNDETPQGFSQKTARG